MAAISTLHSAQKNATAVVQQARRELAAALRMAAKLGFHEGVCNHFTLVVPGETDRYLVNPMGLHFGEIRASDILMVDGEGTVLEGEYQIEPTAFFIHSAIHKAREDAKCVLHTHMPYATALTMIEEGRLEMAHQNAARFYNQIAYDDDYEGLALDKGEGERMAKAMGDKRVLFLANHGVITTGANVAIAFDDLYYLERAAQAQVYAMSTGRKLKPIPGQIAQRTERQITEALPLYAGNHFAALMRQLDRSEPDYAD